MPHQEATHPETPKIYGLLRVLGVNWVFEDQPLAGMKKLIEKKRVGRAKTSTFINFNSTILKMLNISERRAAILKTCARRGSRALVDRRKLRRKALLAHGALIRARVRALARTARSARANAPLTRA